MIAKLHGSLDSIGDDWAVIDVGGVGYLVYCSTRTLAGLPPPGGAATLFVETHVREDHIHLYGFADPGERAWFRLLQTVQGVGAKVALGVLSVLAPADLATAIAAQDRAALTRASGIGPKVAGRILTELRDKAPVDMPQTAVAGATAPDAVPGDGGGVPSEAVSALVNLGFGRSEAFTAVAAASRDLGAEAELSALVRAGLKELSA